LELKKIFQYITVLEGDTLVTKEVADPESVVLRKFDDAGLTMVTLPIRGQFDYFIFLRLYV
jgi:hypothetical protein